MDEKKYRMDRVRVEVFQALSGSEYISEFLDSLTLEGRDRRFAEELAYGVMRRKLTLNYYLKQLADSGKSLKLKSGQRLILHMALYQAIFMDRVPEHAWTNESIELAKAKCPKVIIPFITYLLHKIPKQSFSLPNGDSISDLSIRYSYPEAFVEEVLQEQGLEKGKEVLELGNTRPELMARVLKDTIEEGSIEFPPFRLVHLKKISFSNSSDYYIQNSTPLHLMSYLYKGAKRPKTVLDLCASPGGKMLALRTLFPKAELTVNDINKVKIKRLQENIQKYHLGVRVTEYRGEEYPLTKKFDLIVVDLPCSNSGVFHKRAEARWRYSLENLEQLYQLQIGILRRAVKLLNIGGELWLLTCSLLNSENERLVQELSKSEGLTVRDQKLQLITSQGDDGGYACALHMH
jgi:16S rRNA (cytosine967-C5)-methyltransferase